MTCVTAQPETLCQTAFSDSPPRIITVSQPATIGQPSTFQSPTLRPPTLQLPTARFRRALSPLALLLVAAAMLLLPPAPAAAQIIAPPRPNPYLSTVGLPSTSMSITGKWGRSVQRGWDATGENYGVHLLDRHSICYRPGSTIILGGAHPDPETAWLIEFGSGYGSELLSFGAQPWANEKRRQQRAIWPLGRCLPVADLPARFERARNWQRERDPDGRFIASMTTCKLHQLLDNPCPAVPRNYKLCEAGKEFAGGLPGFRKIDESSKQKRRNLIAAYARYMTRSTSPEKREAVMEYYIQSADPLFMIPECINIDYGGGTPDIPGYP